MKNAVVYTYDQIASDMQHYLYVIIGFDYWYVERFRLNASGELMLFNIKPLKFDVIIIMKKSTYYF